MPSVYKSLTSVVAWTCFIFALIMLIGPTLVGIVTGGLVGTINDVDDGVLWFYRHGLGYLLSFVFFAVYLYAVKVRRTLE